MDAGTMGALMLGGGLVGAVVIPAISDRNGKRTPLSTPWIPVSPSPD